MASAASRARSAVGKAAQKASPMVLKTTPPLVSIAARRRASWRARARRIASGCSSHRRVLPSMSVKRNVIVPLGISDTAVAPGAERNDARQQLYLGDGEFLL